MRRLNKTLAFAVQFARFAAEFGIAPVDLAQMIAHADASKAAYERGDRAGEQKHADECQRLADLSGCKLTWPGLWPMVSNGKRDDLLPSD